MTMIKTRKDLNNLPIGSIIACEIEEYEGTYELTNTASCCGGWHTFDVIDGEMEIVDDYTPCLPAELMA